MARRKIRKKNEIYLSTLLFFAVCISILLAVFLFIENIGELASYLKLEKTTYASTLLDSFCETVKNIGKDDEAGYSDKIKTSTVYGSNAPHVSLYSTSGDCVMITTQLFVSKQPYTEVHSLSEVSRNEQLLIIQTDSLSTDEINVLKELTENGVSLLFIGLPDTQSLSNNTLKSLLGIKTVIGETVWNGLRTAQDLLTGTRVDLPNYEITGIEVVLDINNKVYANALPDNYLQIENMDLPPIIWRHVENGSKGRVYVFNGDYAKTEMGYGILPVVISEINENYIYPVINAFSVLVTGYPCAENESRENWTRLYSRNKMQIQQDMFTSQLVKYAKNYNVKVTCFSPDYEIFKNTDDIELKYFKREIKSARGLLADENGGNLKVLANSDNIVFQKWDCNFEFWNEEKQCIMYPICYDSTIDDTRADDYAIGGFASTLGFFSVQIDYGKYLEYDGEEDPWSVYCSEQEVMMGVLKRDYGWMDTVTADEASGRILQLLELEPRIEYNDDNIKIEVSNFSDEAWFILRSNKEDIEIDNGSIEETGTGCYFVTLKEKNATITWKEN